MNIDIGRDYRDEVQEIRAVQGMLFSDEEKSYWRTRMVHET